MTEQQKPFVSLVIPLLNEAESLGELYSGVTRALQDRYQFEILFIDDGSTDQSWPIIEQLHREHEEVRGISLRANRGKATALAAGFREARGDVIVTMDADLQDEPKDIVRLVEKLEQGYDAVAGWKQWKASRGRLILTRLFNFTVRLTTRIPFHDFNCSLKAYRREVLEGQKLYGEFHRFLPVFAHWRGFHVTELPVENYQRKYGHSRYGIERLWRGFFDLASILFIVRYGKKPMHFFGSIALVLLTIGVVIDGYLTILRFEGGRIGDRPLFMLGTLMIILGVQFFTIGLLAESIQYYHARTEDVSVKKVLTK